MTFTAIVPVALIQVKEFYPSSHIRADGKKGELSRDGVMHYDELINTDIQPWQDLVASLRLMLQKLKIKYYSFEQLKATDVPFVKYSDWESVLSDDNSEEFDPDCILNNEALTPEGLAYLHTFPQRDCSLLDCLFAADYWYLA